MHVYAICALTLLHCTRWEGIFVPSLPRALCDIFQSPVPYVVGTKSPLTVTPPPTAAVLIVEGGKKILKVKPVLNAIYLPT
jgi:hypothetical protein